MMQFGNLSLLEAGIYEIYNITIKQKYGITSTAPYTALKDKHLR